MQCPRCQSQSAIKNGKYSLQDGSLIQHYRCKACSKRFSEKTGTPMFRLRTPTAIDTIALKMRGEGMGVRASSRVLDKSHSTIVGLLLGWQHKRRPGHRLRQWAVMSPWKTMNSTLATL